MYSLITEILMHLLKAVSRVSVRVVGASCTVEYIL